MNEIFKKVEKILFESGIEEFKQEAKLIITEVSGLSLEEILLLDSSAEVIPNKDEIIKIANKRADEKIPLQYLLGFSYFMDEKYLINENVLIPRDETQILVEESYKLIKDLNKKINILDIGTGSGIISCSLAKKLKNKDIEIIAVDKSVAALEIALENISKSDLVRKVVIRKSDLFSKIRECEKFDLIVSNPPYIPLKEKNNLQKELEFEPFEALFAQDDEGVEFYRKIIETAPEFLKKDGFLAFELGINQSKIVKQILEEKFKNINIIKDLAGIERVITAQIFN